jgi:hypothetical protein
MHFPNVFSSRYLPPAVLRHTCLALLFVAALITVTADSAIAQNVTSIVGTGSGGFSGDGGIATAARLRFPLGVLARPDGSILIADSGNNRVRKINVDGTSTTIAGTGNPIWGGDGLLATADGVGMNSPGALAVDQNDNIYIGTYGAIRKINAAGVITTVAGNGIPNSAGDGLVATSAAVQVGLVWGMQFDAAGNLFFTDYSFNVLRKIDAVTGIISRIAGSDAATAYTGENIFAITENLSSPAGLILEADGSIIVAVGDHHRIRKITPDGKINTIAGTGINTSSGDFGLASAATLRSPFGLEADGAGGFYIADIDGHRVRKVAQNGIITTIIGNGATSNTGDGALAVNATIDGPSGLSRDSAGNLIISSYNSHVIRKITAVPPSALASSTFTSYISTSTALGSISPAGAQTVTFGDTLNVTVTAKPRHTLRVTSNCDYVQTNKPTPFVPIDTGVSTYAVTVKNSCQLEAAFKPLVPKVNIATESTANALFSMIERAQIYTTPIITPSASVVGQALTFKAWVTDIAGVPYPSATNVITFKANGITIAGCASVPLTLRASSVIHIREAVCTASFSALGNVSVTSEFAGDTYNFPATSNALQHRVSATP